MFGGSVVGGTFPDRAGVPGFLVLKSFQIFLDTFSMWVTRAGTQRPKLARARCERHNATLVSGEGGIGVGKNIRSLNSFSWKEERTLHRAWKAVRSP